MTMRLEEIVGMIIRDIFYRFKNIVIALLAAILYNLEGSKLMLSMKVLLS